MKKSLWLQLTALSVLITLLVSGIFFIIFTRISAASMFETRKNIYLFLAHLIETPPYTVAIDNYERLRSGAPALGGTLWILSANGDVLGSNTADLPPAAWRAMQKPVNVHDMSFEIPSFSQFAKLILVRLNGNEPIYLLVKPSANTPNKTLAQIHALIFICSLLSATLTSLLMVVFYLRKTSLEAKQVISALRDNNLSARFAIRPFDKNQQPETRLQRNGNRDRAPGSANSKNREYTPQFVA